LEPVHAANRAAAGEPVIRGWDGETRRCLRQWGLGRERGAYEAPQLRRPEGGGKEGGVKAKGMGKAQVMVGGTGPGAKPGTADWLGDGRFSYQSGIRFSLRCL
jgi:hypothetical protein